jgi:acetolactate synthase I/II/III large subunit
MGYGLPAAIAAKFACPERPVICVAGDGCFMMAAHELATVKLHDLDLLVFVVANGSYGTIRMHQERSFPGRVAGTDLANPDFTLLAAAYGLPGWLIESDADVERVLDEALARGRGLVEIRTGIEDIAPGLALSTLRAAAQPVPGRQ